jgi:hypothetical protein
MTNLALALLSLGLVAGCNHTITVSAEAASLVAAQDGDGAWIKLSKDGDRDVSFDVSGDSYGFAYVCPGDGGELGPWARVRLATLADAEPVTDCLPPRTVSLVIATGVPGASVYAGGSAIAAGPSGYAQLQVLPGQHDILVLADEAAGARATIVRDVEVSATRTYDLSAGARWTPVAHVAWPSAPPPPAGAVRLVLRTCSGTTFALQGTSYAFDLAGSGLLAGCDHAAYGFLDGIGPRQRYVEVPPAAGAAVSAWPAASEVAIDAHTLSWSGDWDEVSLSTWEPWPIEQQTTAARFVAAGDRSAVPIVDVAALPGWHPGMPGLAAGATTSWNARVSRGTAFASLELVDDAGTLQW